MKTILWQGDFNNLNSFKLSNERITQALIDLGFQVDLTPTDIAMDIALEDQPDVYIVHNYPYNVKDAPGKLNLFFLQYEYFEFQAQDQFLTVWLNTRFDGVLVSSEFTRQACLNSGVTTPVYVLPLGAVPEQFHPEVKPYHLGLEKNFKFINLGGAFDRKGIDVLINAYSQEFTANDDVALVLKAFSYQKHLPWIEKKLAIVQNTPNAPVISFIHEEVEDVAGYYTACDIGVYPYRGEGFGLTILESLACGLPVIVTDGGSTDDFCSEENSMKIKASRKVAGGKHFMEPDIDHLRQLMREAFNQWGSAEIPVNKISATVATYTWDQSAKILVEIIDELEQKKSETKKPILSFSSSKKIVLIHSEIEEDNIVIQAFLEKSKHHDSSFVLQSFRDSNSHSLNQEDYLIANAGYALEIFRQLNSEGHSGEKILIVDRFPFKESLTIELAQRKAAGIENETVPGYKPMDVWRQQQEFELANQLVVFDQVTKKILQKKYPAKRIHKLSLPISQNSSGLIKSKPGEPLKFLFWGNAPFQRGIVDLFTAWDILRPLNAELHCLMESKLFMMSNELIRVMIQNHSIKIHNLLEIENPDLVIADCDVQLLPVVADGMYLPAVKEMIVGKPLIVSSQSGMQDIITPKENGVIYTAGNVHELATAMQYYIDQSDDFLKFQKNCAEYMQQFSNTQFVAELLTAIRS